MIAWNCPAFVNVPLTAGIASRRLISALLSSFSTKRIRVAQ